MRAIISLTALALAACSTPDNLAETTPDPAAKAEPVTAATDLPIGATRSPDGYLSVLDAPQPSEALFAKIAHYDAYRRGITPEEAAYRDSVIRKLSRAKEVWWNALIDREPGILRGSYMDWSVETPDGRGQEVVILNTEFPVQTLSYYVTDPQIRAEGPDAARAVNQARKDFASSLRALGLSVERTTPTFRPRMPPAPIVIDAAYADLVSRYGAEALDPPPGVSLYFKGAAANVPSPYASWLRVDPGDHDYGGAYIQPYRQGRIILRDGCVLIERDGEDSLARIDGLTPGIDAEGYAALLDELGKMGVRFGTRIGYSGGARAVPAAPDDAAACGVTTEMWLPEATSELESGPFNRYR